MDHISVDVGLKYCRLCLIVGVLMWKKSHVSSLNKESEGPGDVQVFR